MFHIFKSFIFFNAVTMQLIRRTDMTVCSTETNPFPEGHVHLQPFHVMITVSNN